MISVVPVIPYLVKSIFAMLFPCLSKNHFSEQKIMSTKQLDQEACRNGRTDNAGHVGAHGVHQQEVVGVGLPAHILGHTGRHGNGGHARGADQRVDLAAGQHVHQLAHQQAADGGEAEGDDAQHHDGDGLEG